MQKYLELQTEKGTMRGFVYLPDQERYPLVIISHGFTGHKSGCYFMYARLARRLEKAGIAAIRMDFLGSGDSDLEFYEMTFSDEVKQVETIIDYVQKNEKVSEIYLLGHSMGGTVSSVIASKYPDLIRRCVLWAPAFSLPSMILYLSKRSKPLPNGHYDVGGLQVSQEFVDDMVSKEFYQNLGLYKNPILILQGKEDKTVPCETVRSALPFYSQDVNYIEIEECDHNFSNYEASECVMNETFNFFTK